MIPVTIVKVSGDASLVEFVEDGRLQRCTIPSNKIKNGESSATTLNAGIPFGVDWESRISVSITPKDIANALRNRGIWTHEDAKKFSRQVTLAIQTACRIDLSKIYGGE